MTASVRLIRMVAICVTMVASISAQAPNLAQLRQEAEAGNPEAQFELAKWYLGADTRKPVDPAQGLDWLRKSALNGYAGAQVTLGYLYQSGTKILQQNPHEAANWYRKAIGQKNKSAKDAEFAKRAQADLSKMLAQGLISKQEAGLPTYEPTHGAKEGKAMPFSLGEIETGLSGGITNKRMATLVREFGVSFRVSPVIRKRLADKGADESLLATVSSSNRSF